MRKSNNYFKFLEYVTYGKDHDSTIDKGNSVLECKSYASISDIEYRYNTTFGFENEWLTFKNILIDEDTLYVYYLEGENSTLVGVYLLDNFKTQKELKYTITKACTEFLYDILLEKSELREAKENVECAKGNDVFEGCKMAAQTDEEVIKDTIISDDNNAYQTAKVTKTKHSVLDVMECLMCPADREGNRCGGKQWCKQTWKRYDAIVNPEWHHVSIATLASIDNDMLDEKRRNYMYLYNLIKDFRKYAFEIIRKDVYFETTSNVFRNIQQLYFNNVISFTTYDYAAKHIQTIGVEKGWFDSKSEETFGYKESRRYKVTLR